jgi:putative transposase
LPDGLALWLRPTRLLRSAIVLKPSTLLGLHQAMGKQKYRMRFSPNHNRKPGPKGASAELVHAVVEMKRKCQSKHTVDRLIRSQRDFTA